MNHGRRHFLKSASAAGLLGSCAAYVAPSSRIQRSDVLVLGAGLSGLAAATALSDAGYDVRVLEASERPGGRTWTGFDLPDRPEFGAVEVGQSYRDVRAAAARFGVSISAFAHAEIYRSTAISVGEWPAMSFDQFRALGTPIPQGLLPRLMRETTPGRDIASIVSAPDLSIVQAMEQVGFSAKERALFLANGNFNAASTASMKPFWRALALYTGAPSEVFLDGTQSLANAMAAALPQGVLYGAQVSRISSGSDGVVVETAGGQRYGARAAVVTLPPTVLQTIAVDASLPSGLTNLIASADATAVTQVLIETEPFWEEDGLPAYMWSDGPLGRFFPRVLPGGQVIGYKIWANGAQAKALDRMDFAALSGLIGGELARLRPASHGRFDLTQIVSWGPMPMARGAFYGWPLNRVPESLSLYGAAYDGLIFAGEHCLFEMPGMEGAMRSGAQAAQNVRALLS